MNSAALYPFPPDHDRADSTSADAAESAPIPAHAGTLVASEVEDRWRSVISREFRGAERDHLARLLDLNPETFRGLASPSPEKQRRPKLGDAVAALAMCRFPAAAFDAMLEPAGYRVVPLADDAGCPHVTLSAAADLLSVLAAALSPHGPGGARITQEERRILEPALAHVEDAARRLRTMKARGR